MSDLPTTSGIMLLKATGPLSTLPYLRQLENLDQLLVESVCGALVGADLVLASLQLSLHPVPRHNNRFYIIVHHTLQFTLIILHSLQLQLYTLFTLFIFPFSTLHLYSSSYSSPSFFQPSQNYHNYFLHSASTHYYRILTTLLLHHPSPNSHTLHTNIKPPETNLMILYLDYHQAMLYGRDNFRHSLIDFQRSFSCRRKSATVFDNIMWTASLSSEISRFLRHVVVGCV